MRLAALLLVAGCFGKPGFTQRDAAGDGEAPACSTQPSAAGITIDSATGPLVTLPGNISIGFADELNRFPMPDRLSVGGLDVVGPREGCQFEDQIGLAVFPVYSVAAELPLPGTTHHLERLHVGPAFTALQTVWSYPLGSCPDGATVAAGNTVWSMFPDGKIVRTDSITPTMQTDITPNGCQCGGATGASTFLVTSYAAFETSVLRAITFDDDATEQTALSTTGVELAHRSACATLTNNGRIAMTWDRIDNMDPATPPTRIRIRQPTTMGNNITAFVYDMVTNIATLVHGSTYSIRTHMLLDAGTGHGDCVVMQSTLDSFVNIQALTIDGMTVAYGAQGVFDDQRAHTAPVTLSGTLPAGFTVHVRFPGFRAVRTSRAADQVIWQVEGDGDFYVFFREPLVSSITITPECGA